MKKIFIFVLLLLLVPAICLAEPQVTSDKQTFNPFTGVYDLQGNVHVEIGDRIITGDAAQVSMYKLEVHGQGNITFTQGDMIISADTGSFNWSTKNAVFNGNVIVNGEPKNGEVIYNVREKVFVN